MTYSKLNVEPREDRTVQLTQNGNVMLERYSIEVPQYKAVNITWDVDYTDDGPCPKEIIIPHAFAHDDHIDEDLIEKYISDTNGYIDFSSYDLEPVRLIAEDIEWETDNEEELKNLPKSIEIPEDIEAEEIERYLSDKTGFLHKSFKIEVY